MFNIVVSFKNIKAKGKSFERFGFYSPFGKRKIFFLNFDRLAF
jgi:ribosomal protein S16